MPPQMEVAAQPEFQVVSAVSNQATPVWNLARRIAFRFGFAYFVLYCLPFPIGALPYTDKLAEWYELGWHKVVPWVGRHILRLGQPITIFSNGSGDTTYDYAKVFCFLLLAGAATIVWSLLDRQSTNYSRAHRWLRFYIRLTLGATLLTYGAYKVIPSQFPPLWQYRYLSTYGDSSPMGLLWSFMAASKSYTIFAGSVEMLAGILLFVPRLTTLGALIGIGAMTQVFILNMSYDVPVKLYSFHLLLLGAFLLLPELKRLAGFFVFNCPTEPATPELHFDRKRLNLGLLIAQVVLGVFFSGYALHASREQLRGYAEDQAAEPLLRGAWSVDEFTLGGQLRPPLLTDDVRWQKAIFDIKTALTVQAMDGSLLRLAAKTDSAKKTIELTKRADPTWKATLAYDVYTPQAMVMEGEIGTQKVHIKLHRLNPKYLLNTRGFHWINEYPLNR